MANDKPRETSRHHLALLTIRSANQSQSRPTKTGTDLKKKKRDRPKAVKWEGKQAQPPLAFMKRRIFTSPSALNSWRSGLRCRACCTASMIG